MTLAQRDLLSMTASAEIYWNAGIQCVEYEPRRALTLEESKESLDRALEAVTARQGRKVLVNLIAENSFTPEKGAWVETDWVPRAIKGGVKAFALVLPEVLASAMELDKTAGRIDPTATGHSRRMFENVESARDWLAKQ